MRIVAVRLVVAAALAVIALAGRRRLAQRRRRRWSPDGLFYQARVYEIRDGMSQPEALREAFQGPLGAAPARDRPGALGQPGSGSPTTPASTSAGIAVPLAAAAIEPLAGDRAILDVSLAGYVAAVLADLLAAAACCGFRLPIAAARRAGDDLRCPR